MLGIEATCYENEDRVGEGKDGMDGCVYLLVSHSNLCVCMCVCVRVLNVPSFLELLEF